MPFTIHDHFDGSAHCMECSGPCRLTGQDLAVTRLVCYVFEDLARRGAMPRMIEAAMTELEVPVASFIRRAKKSTDRMTQW